MIYHYMKVALRNLLKYRTHSIISVLCLAVGITFFTLVNHFINSVFNNEKLPRAEEEIRFVPTRESYANFFHWEDVCFLQAQEIIGIDSLVAVSYQSKVEMTLFDQQQKEHPCIIECKHVSANYFNCRGIHLMESRQTLTAPNEVIVSESFARRILGNKSPIGLILHLDAGSWKDNSFKDFKIVNVAKGGILDKGDKTEVFFHPETAPKKVYSVGSYLNGKVSLDKVNEQLKKVEWTGNNKIISCDAQMTLRDNTSRMITSVFVRFLSSLILLSGIINFLKFIIQIFYNRQRELGIRQCLGSNWKGMFGLLFSEVFMETKDKPLSCDYKAIEKGNHPVLLAFVRAAHLAGCTVAIREKGTAIQERVANKALSSFVSECTSSITRKSVEKKKEDDEMKEKKEKYGYYK